MRRETAPARPNRRKGFGEGDVQTGCPCIGRAASAYPQRSWVSQNGSAGPSTGRRVQSAGGNTETAPEGARRPAVSVSRDVDRRIEVEDGPGQPRWGLWAAVWAGLLGAADGAPATMSISDAVRVSPDIVYCTTACSPRRSFMSSEGLPNAV